MNDWVRVASSLPSDPKTHRLAEELGVRLAEAGGSMVFVMLNFPSHAPDGCLKKIPDSMLEDWAKWRGAPGAFATAFRAICLNRRQTWVAWEKHNGAPLRAAKAARDRMQRRRDAQTEGTLILALDEGKRSANASPNGTANGSPLRTNERTNSSNRVTYVPGQSNLPVKPFCSHCVAVLTAIPGYKREQLWHDPQCPDWTAPPAPPTPQPVMP